MNFTGELVYKNDGSEHHPLVSGTFFYVDPEDFIKGHDKSDRNEPMYISNTRITPSLLNPYASEFVPSKKNDVE